MTKNKKAKQDIREYAAKRNIAYNQAALELNELSEINNITTWYDKELKTTVATDLYNANEILRFAAKVVFDRHTQIRHHYLETGEHFSHINDLNPSAEKVTVYIENLSFSFSDLGDSKASSEQKQKIQESVYAISRLGKSVEVHIEWHIEMPNNIEALPIYVRISKQQV